TPSSGLLVADTYNGKLKRFSPDGLRLEAFFEGAADSRLSQPAGLSVLPSGEVLVADTNNHRIVKVSANGERAYELTRRGARRPQRADRVACRSAASPRRGLGAAGRAAGGGLRRGRPRGLLPREEFVPGTAAAPARRRPARGARDVAARSAQVGGRRG